MNKKQTVVLWMIGILISWMLVSAPKIMCQGGEWYRESNWGDYGGMKKAILLCVKGEING